VNDTIDLSFELISLYGRGSVSGTSTEVVNAKVFGLDRQEYVDITSTIWINHTSAYGLAWYHLFNSTLSEGLDITTGIFDSDPDGVLFLRFRGLEDGTPVYQVQTVWDAANRVYRTSVAILSTGVLALDAFLLQHAHVQVGIGEAAEGF
jgi:hypothetical protein